MTTKYINDRSNARKYAARHGGEFIGPVKIDGKQVFAVSLPDQDGEPVRDINADLTNVGTTEGDPELPSVFEGGIPLPAPAAELGAELAALLPAPAVEQPGGMCMLRLAVCCDDVRSVGQRIATLTGFAVEMVGPKGTLLDTLQPGAARATSARRAAAAPRANGERVNPTHERLKARMRTAEGLSLREIVAETGWIESASRKFVWTLRNKKGVAVQDRKEAERGLVYFLPAEDIAQAA